MDTTKRQPGAAESAREIMLGALKGALATLEAGTGVPYASLVSAAFGPDGAPLLLISDLALHTRNLKADARASLLFDASSGAGDPLAGGRVTVIGRMHPVTGEAAAFVRQRFLARQPGAGMYADFADFAFWRMAVERAHYVGGFGRIVDIGAEKLLTDLAGAEALIAAEPDIVAHMNEDHADAVALYATQLAGQAEGAWQMTGIDPAGLDLSNGERGVRLAFDSRITSPGEARAALVAMAERARRSGHA